MYILFKTTILYANIYLIYYIVILLHFHYIILLLFNPLIEIFAANKQIAGFSKKILRKSTSSLIQFVNSNQQITVIRYSLVAIGVLMRKIYY